MELILGEGHTGLASRDGSGYRITLPDKLLERGPGVAIYVVRHEMCHIVGGDADIEWESLPLTEQVRRHILVEQCVCAIAEEAMESCSRVNGG